jgi:hypothetical protein
MVTGIGDVPRFWNTYAKTQHPRGYDAARAFAAEPFGAVWELEDSKAVVAVMLVWQSLLLRRGYRGRFPAGRACEG